MFPSIICYEVGMFSHILRNETIFFSHRLLLPLRCCYCTSPLPLSATSDQQKFTSLKHYELIKDFTGCSSEAIQYALMRNKKIQSLDEKVVKRKLDLIKDLNLTDLKTPNIIPFLGKHPSRLKNRYEALHEYGIYPHLISTSLIKRFFILCKSSVSKLKKEELIDKNADVLQNLWKAADLSPESCPKMNDEASLYSLKAIAIKAYLEQKLDISDVIMPKMERQFLYRLQNKSFKTINQNYYIFKDIIGLSKHRMAKNWYILRNDPDNIIDMLNRIKKVGNMDVKDCLHVYPKISVMTSENMEKIIQYVEAAGIPSDTFQRCLKLFTLNCETVNKRIIEMKNYDYFLFNLKHPRILLAVHYLVKAKKRMEILEKMKLNLSIGGLASNKSMFERLCLTSYKPYGSDCLRYLCTELKWNKQELIKKLKRHRRWNYVPIVYVGRNLQALRKSFSDDEIMENIYILFYPNEKVNMELENLDSQEGLEMFKENGTVKQEYILPLVLYYIEKESNFTGESVWELETNVYQDLPDPLELVKSCS